MSGTAKGSSGLNPVDPVTFEVVWHRLLDCTEEMGIKYMRTSGSPILVGAYDASTGICLPDGQLVALGPYITTQAHVLPLIIRAVQDHCGENPGIGKGDLFICNDPYLGATHQPDVATVGPVVAEGRTVAWVGASGHWIDIGGPEPGGFNMNARSVFDEGLRMPPTRIVESGTVREDLVALIVNQVRDRMAELDLRGQVVANQTGEERILALCDEYGSATVELVMRGAIEHVERGLRRRLRNMPDGRWREVQFIDHDGHEGTLRQIVCTVTKQGEGLTIDFTGTADQSMGFVNCTFGGLRAAVLSAIGIVLGWDLPWNEGLAHCVELVAPPGTACTATFPAPVSMATITPIILSLNVTFAALSKMLLASGIHVEEAMANWCGTSLAPTIIGPNEHGVPTVSGETSHFAAGCGARTYADGVDTGGIIINTTASIPSIEAVESEYPVLYLMRRQMVDSGGPGRFRGGLTGEVALLPYHAGGPVSSSFAGCGSETPNAFGLAGGLPGAAARFVRFTDGGVDTMLQAAKPLPASFDELPGTAHVTSLNTSQRPFPSSAIEYHNWQGGGGYGDPTERAPDSVARDVHRGAVSVEEAQRVYGVVLSDGKVDNDATNAARQSIKAQRKASGQRAADELGAWLESPNDPSPGKERQVVDYGDAVRFDFGAETVSCLACGWILGSAAGDFRRWCLVGISDVTAAGPGRGQDYRSDRVRIRAFCCPGCGRQLDVEVGVEGAVRSGFAFGSYLEEP
jgi:N-methylhydantoinase B